MIEWTFTDTMIIIASLLLILNSFYKMRKYNEKLKESECKGDKTEAQRKKSSSNSKYF